MEENHINRIIFFCPRAVFQNFIRRIWKYKNLHFLLCSYFKLFFSGSIFYAISRNKEELLLSPGVQADESCAVLQI